MNVLVVNDDGIESKGLRVLVDALAEIEGNVIYVVAPDGQRSCTGHGISLMVPVMVHEREYQGAEKAYSISGLPADCTKLGVRWLKSQFGIDIDVVFSGINHGGNTGTDVLYSGTLAAAIEGILCGKPAVAISVTGHKPVPGSLENCHDIIQQVFSHVEEIGNETVINVNVPNVPPEEVKGLRVTRLGPREYHERYDMLTNPIGEMYFWYKGEPVIYYGLPEDVDIMSTQDGYVSVTPLHIDMTNYDRMEEVQSWNLSYKTKK